MRSKLVGRVGIVAAATVATLAAAVPANAAAAAAPKMRDLGNLGGVGATATAINDRGQVIGTSRLANGEYHVFRWERGTMTDLGGSFDPVAINNRGDIAGNTYRNSASHAAIMRNGTVTDLGTLGGAASYAHGINNRGEVVGSSDAADGSHHAFVYRGGRMVDLGTGPGGGWTSAYDINDHGDIAGSVIDHASNIDYAAVWRGGKLSQLDVAGMVAGINNRGDLAINSGTHVLLWHKGTTTDLGGLAGDPHYGFYANATGFNDRGDVSGSSNAADGRHGVIWRDGRLVDLGVGTNAFGLNNKGQAAGNWQTGTYGDVRAVLWS